MNASSLVSDGLWESIERLLPKEVSKPKGGRLRVPDRAALAGIDFVLRTWCPWRLLPKELGCGSGWTCWRRLRDWQAAGVRQRLHETLLNWLGNEAAIDWSRASADTLSIRANRGASGPDRTPSTAANSAPSTTSWWIGMASRSRSASQQPMLTMPLSCSHSSMPSHPLSAHAGRRVARGSVQPSCTPTKPTTPPTCDVLCVPEGSPRASRAAGSIRASDSGDTGGWSSAPTPGCLAAAGSASATSRGRMCSRAAAPGVCLDLPPVPGLGRGTCFVDGPPQPPGSR
jgi:transposase